MKLAVFIFFLTFISIFSVHASTGVDYYLSKAKQLNLAKDRTWQRLMYVTSSTGQSEVSYSGFFYDKNGKSNLEKELHANIQELFITRESDQSIQCKFPARSAWLIQQLEIPQQDLSTPDCPALTEWLAEIKPHKAVLIYATDFMGNPSSMFGHTLLRLDPENQKELNLISYAVNYAATVQNNDSFSFAWKGLTGQYPGEYSLMPYYRKVKEYGDFESRDLWEYELALNSEETTRLVQHIWELKHVQFPYYFINDNCAYRLLGLIDLVKPNADLQPKFNHVAIPVETIKAVQQQGLIVDTVYRPALETQLLDQANQHGKKLAQAAKLLTDIEPNQMAAFLQKFGIIEQAQILEMAYDHLYLQLIAQQVDSKIAQPRIRQILSLRSQLNVEKQRSVTVTPEHDPVDGHHARNFSIQAGKIQGENFIQLNHRQAYHDLIDPQAGYRIGTQLKFFDGALQYRDSRLKIESFDLIEVNSYSPVTPFKMPLSWGFNLSWKQEAIDQHGHFSNQEQHGVMNISSQFGYSLADLERRNLCFAQLKNHLQFGKYLDKGWRFGLGPTVGCQNILTEKINSLVQIELPYWEDQHQWGVNLHSAIQYVFHPQHAIRFNWHYQFQNHQNWNQTSLGWIKYF